MSKFTLRNIVTSAIFTCGCTLSSSTLATIVEIQTSQGNFQINLYDETTPKTVENFLSYVRDGSYTDIVFHRAIEDFILQAGGYSYGTGLPFERVTSKGPIINEPVYSNIRGTISMAKAGGNPNSASSEWFINQAENSGNLDIQNGGFTAFGEVIVDDIVGDGMAIVDKIIALPKCQAYNFTDLPVPGVGELTCREIESPTVTDFAIIKQIIIIDSSIATAQNLTPPLTRDTDHDGVLNEDDAFPENPNESKDSDGDGVGDNSDAFPNDENESKDTDGDGIGDNSDPFPTVPKDTDEDGVSDNKDAFPEDPNESKDSDSDGIGDNADEYPNDPTNSPPKSSGSFAWLSLALLTVLRLKRSFS